MGCLTGLAKYIIFFFNFVIFLCAILIIVFGAISKSDEGFGKESFEKFSVSSLAIVVGVFIGLVAFFGCCGAIKESSCLLTTYAIIMILLFIFQLVVGILGYVAIKDKTDLEKEVNEVVNKVYANYTSDSEVAKIINEFQVENKCCGPQGPNSFPTAPSLPSSCCKSNSTSCKSDDTNDVFTTGCSSVFLDLFMKNIKIIAGIAVGFAVIEIIGAIFACMVRNSISKSKQYV